MTRLSLCGTNPETDRGFTLTIKSRQVWWQILVLFWRSRFRLCCNSDEKCLIVDLEFRAEEGVEGKQKLY